MKRAALVLLGFLALTACLPGQDGGTGLADEAITVTALDAEQDAGTIPADARPAPRPEDLTTPEAPAEEAAEAEADVVPQPEPEAEATPAAPKSEAQIACERLGGRWLRAGKSSAMTCIMPTRDGGQSCRRESDCEGYCLARSMTCAPFTPMFGCNEIIQDNGVRVTLCID